MVGEQDHAGRPGELGGVGRPPFRFLVGLRGALDVGGRGQATGGEAVAILLALDDEDRRALGDGLAQFGQAVKHGGSGAGLVDPSAGFVLMSNPKVLGGVADLLADLDPGGVAVAVGRHDLPPAGLRFRGEVEGGHDAVVTAAGEAVQQESAIHFDRQGGIVVLVAGAAGFVAVARLDRAVAGDPLQGGQRVVERTHDRPRSARGLAATR